MRWGILSVYRTLFPITEPSAPQNLTIAVLSNSSLTVEWVGPADDGGIDVGITYTVTLQGGPGATTRTVSSLRTTFTGLEAPITYTVTVAAVNCAGLSPPATSTISFRGNSVHYHGVCVCCTKYVIIRRLLVSTLLYIIIIIRRQLLIFCPPSIISC